MSPFSTVSTYINKAKFDLEVAHKSEIFFYLVDICEEISEMACVLCVSWSITEAS